MKHLILPIALAAMPLHALADAPNVVADIAPVHSLVARVMEGVGVPSVIVPQTASPHGFSMRVSQATALEQADLVVWVGHDLTPWLEGPLDTLAGDAALVTLLESAGLSLLPYREEEHDDDEHADLDDHSEDDTHASHDHSGEVDPHIWLDPANAAAIVASIAAALSDVDPDHATTYQANAAAAQAELVSLQAEIAAQLAPVTGTPFMVLHDAYQYFDARFELSYEGSILDVSGASPGPAGLAEVQKHLAEDGVACVLTEPQLNASLADTVAAGQDVRIGQIDPIGAGLELGPQLYPSMMRAVSTGIAMCLG